MVAVIENWSCIAGVVTALLPAAQGADFPALRIAVAGVEPVQGFANLLGDSAGATIEVRLRAGQLADPPPAGAQVRVPVRRGGPKVLFAHPDWSMAGGSPLCGPNR